MHYTTRHSRIAIWSAVPLALVASGALIATSSYAAFSDTTENAANAWSTGKVTISDNDKGAALFAATDLAPGSTGDNCIDVTADTTVDSTVRMYASGVQDTKALGTAIRLHVERGDLATSGDCSTMTNATPVFDGTLAGFSANPDFGAGVGEWKSGTTPTTTTYRISYTVEPSADNTMQEATANASFVWEAQSD